MPATTSESTPAASPSSLADLLRDGASAKEIERTLDALPPEERVAAVLEITGKNVGKLYEAMAEAPPLAMEEIVPAATPEGETIIFEGRNSLFTFSRFQKRFMRVGADIVGYNHQTWSFVTGPGYFLIKPALETSPHPTELYFDYTEVPAAAPEGWPALKVNDKGLSRPVYGGMHDFMRRVATGIMVGKAYKQGIEQGAWFTLSRG